MESWEGRREANGVGAARKLCPLHERGRDLIARMVGGVGLRGRESFGGEEVSEWGLFQSAFLPLVFCLPSFVSHSLWPMYPSMRGAP